MVPDGPVSAGCTRQVVFLRAGDVELATGRLPNLGADDLLVSVRRVGICATDLHLLDGHIGDPFPLVPGHEFVGEVAAVGAASTRGLAVGDRVTVEMLLPCRACSWCRRGRYNLCEQDDPAAGRPAGRQYGVNIPRTVGHGLWGGYADHVLAPPEAVVHRLPPDLDWDEAVLVEPLAVAFHAVSRGRIGPGDRVVVLGPGPVGLLVAAAARSAGAATVVVVGTRPERLARAKDFGADDTLAADAADVGTALHTAMGGLADVVVEAAGSVQAQQLAVRLVRRGGRVVLAGACGAGAPVTFDADGDLLTREIDVLPSFLSSGGYEPAIDLLGRRDFPVRTLVTHHFPLADVQQAFDVVRHRRDGVLKAVLVPGDPVTPPQSDIDLEA